MKIERVPNSKKLCEDCLIEYPDAPLEATTRIDHRYMCDVHADELINQDLYAEIDEEYSRLDSDE